MAYATAQTIINRTAIQCGAAAGLASGLGDPFAAAASDDNFALLVELLTSLGDDLQQEHDWPQLRKTFTTTMQLGVNSYPLPADFHEMIDQSGWNRTTRMPLVGPASPQQWEYLASRYPGILVNVVFRLAGDTGTGPNMEVNPNSTPPVGSIVAFEYVSTFWVMTQGQTSADKDAPDAATDTLFYDAELLIKGLKWRWLLEKGFAADAAEQIFRSSFSHCIGKSVGAGVLSLGGSAKATERPIDDRNLPATGFGL